MNFEFRVYIVETLVEEEPIVRVMLPFSVPECDGPDHLQCRP